MQFVFTEEQHQFREVVKRFLRDKSPTTEVRRLMETDDGFDPVVWKQLSEELALPSLIVPEKYGGAGFGFVELSIVMEEMGHSLLCAPYFSSVVLAANAILNAGTEEQKLDLLPQIASGSIRATLAVTESSGRWEATAVELAAKTDGDGFILQGEKCFVVDGHTADKIIVVARLEGSDGDSGISFFVVDGEAPGIKKTLLKTVDPTRKLARLEFDGVQAQPLGEPGAGLDALNKTLDQAAIALSNEMIGGTQYLMDSTVEYSKVRMQFGRVIGSFQAIKHKCADMLIQLELAKSAAYHAAAALDEGDENVPVLASMAKSAASDAYIQVAADSIQVHGGIGFTWDQDTHLWFKRAKSSEVFLGDPAYHRELMMQRWGEGI
ncbi:MAG: acyl-CoA dehydrogenase [Gammaproteobacteria bacterium]|jgi:alkylation response protein AidB-like acyl-CoA dehydrogenase|nr:acyl-CoA dehydrogenase [Gammaproteobacteria bacterium]